MADTAVASETPAPATPAKKAPKAAAAAKKPKARPTHPKTSEMVNSAIKELKERSGSSLQAIKKYIASNYSLDAERLAPFIRKYLKRAVASGTLIQTKGKGASGSFKIDSKSGTGGAAKKATATSASSGGRGSAAAASSAAKSAKKPSAPAKKTAASAGARSKKAAAAAASAVESASPAKAGGRGGAARDKKAAAAAKRKPAPDRHPWCAKQRRARPRPSTTLRQAAPALRSQLRFSRVETKTRLIRGEAYFRFKNQYQRNRLHQTKLHFRPVSHPLLNITPPMTSATRPPHSPRRRHRGPAPSCKPRV
ncbi:histone H1B-like [Pieris napi]|uniref:histone H1B-like n=1 Tax=Pieris napi TaxID=78633 RepID=UPI001FBB6CB4|nr:histone H1B-like [Pieris napi]